MAKTQLPDKTDISKVTVFDLENKLVAYSGTFVEGVRAIVSGWNCIFVLTNDGQVSILRNQSGTVIMIHAVNSTGGETDSG